VTFQKATEQANEQKEKGWLVPQEASDLGVRDRNLLTGEVLYRTSLGLAGFLYRRTETALRDGL
jgi:hypothetical protein